MSFKVLNTVVFINAKNIQIFNVLLTASTNLEISCKSVPQ